MNRLRIALFASVALVVPMGACQPTPPSRAPAPAPVRGPLPARPPHLVRSPEPARAPEPTRGPAPTATAPSREGWNDAQIDWQPYEGGLARAREERRPVCLVMHADWCPHCLRYSHVFEDPRIVERARDFVMVRIDVDDEPDVARRHELDGRYVPRTYFLAPDGSVLEDVDARRPRFRYFYDENDPGSLLASMEAVLARR